MEQADEYEAGHPRSPAERWWDAEGVRALRTELGDSQQEFAERLGTRQQTVSEWERGTSKPARMAQRLLTLVAEQAAGYRTARDDSNEANK